MGQIGSGTWRTIAALLLSGGTASAQIPVGPLPKAEASNTTCVEEESEREAGTLLDARERYLRLLRESRAKAAAAESAAASAVSAEVEARAELSALQARLAYVSVLVQGPAGADTRVTCDGQPLPAGSLGVPLPLLPGRHEFQALSNELESATVVLTLEAGAIEMVSLTLPTPGDETSWPLITLSSSRCRRWRRGRRRNCRQRSHGPIGPISSPPGRASASRRWVSRPAATGRSRARARSGVTPCMQPVRRAVQPRKSAKYAGWTRAPRPAPAPAPSRPLRSVASAWPRLARCSFSSKTGGAKTKRRASLRWSASATPG